MEPVTRLLGLLYETRTGLAATTVLATVTFLSLARYTLSPGRPAAIPSPLKTALPRLSERELELLEYKPDSFPGARDVSTPVRLPVASPHV